MGGFEDLLRDNNLIFSLSSGFFLIKQILVSEFPNFANLYFNHMIKTIFFSCDTTWWMGKSSWNATTFIKTDLSLSYNTFNKQQTNVLTSSQRLNLTMILHYSYIHSLLLQNCHSNNMTIEMIRFAQNCNSVNICIKHLVVGAMKLYINSWELTVCCHNICYLHGEKQTPILSIINLWFWRCRLV